MVEPVPESEEDWDALWASFTAHAEIIGRVNISWNMCQLLVFSLFYMLSGMTWERARAVFFSLTADVQQRAITTALALELPKTRSPRKKITTAIARLSDLAGERNAAIHTMWQVSPELGGLIPADGIVHNPRLKMDDPAAQFHALDSELNKVHTALMKAVLAMAAYGPLPGKPDEQNRGP